MRKHLLVIGGNDSSAVQASQLDADVTLFQLRRFLTPAQLDAARRVLVFDFENIDETLTLARCIHSMHRFDAVASFWERALLPAAVVGEAMGINANPVYPVRTSRDKIAMRELLAARTSNTVKFKVCSSPAELGRFLAEIGGPIVLKPANGSGSVGVSLVARSNELDAAWKWASATGLGPLMAEAYVDGPEYSVETLSVGGKHRILGITEKFTNGAPHFIEIGHRFPAELPEAIERKIHDVVTELLDWLHHQVGPAHTEIRLADGTPLIIETHTRFGGDQIWEMVELVSGVSLTRATCSFLLGLALPAAEPAAGGAAIRFLAYEMCEIVAVSGVEQARAHPGIVRLDCKLRNGTTLGPLDQSKARQGYVLAAAATGGQAWDAATQALAKLQVVHTPVKQQSVCECTT